MKRRRMTGVESRRAVHATKHIMDDLGSLSPNDMVNLAYLKGFEHGRKSQREEDERCRRES